MCPEGPPAPVGGHGKAPRCRFTRRWKTSRRATSRSGSERPTCRCSRASATQRQTRAQAARAGAPRHRDPAARVPLQVDRQRGRRTGPSCSAASRRTTSSSRTRRSARRRRPRSSATTLKKSNPREARQAAGDRELAQDDDGPVAQGGHRATTRCSSTTTPASRRPTFPHEPAAGVPAARRGLLLPRVRVRAVRRHGERAPRLPRPHHEDAELEVHPERVPRLRRALLQRGAGRPDASGSPAKQAYQKVITKPPPDNKVYGYAWYKLAYVFWNQGDLAARARRVQEDDRLRDAVRAAPEREEARRERAQGPHPGLRARGQPDRRLQLLQEPERRRGGVERQDLQDDGRPGPELPGHRSLSRGDRALQGPHGPRQRRATSSASISRTSPKRRWR